MPDIEFTIRHFLTRRSGSASPYAPYGRRSFPSGPTVHEVAAKVTVAVPEREARLVLDATTFGGAPQRHVAYEAGDDLLTPVHVGVDEAGARGKTTSGEGIDAPPLTFTACRRAVPTSYRRGSVLEPGELTPQEAQRLEAAKQEFVASLDGAASVEGRFCLPADGFPRLQLRLSRIWQPRYDAIGIGGLDRGGDPRLSIPWRLASGIDPHLMDVATVDPDALERHDRFGDEDYADANRAALAHCIETGKARLETRDIAFVEAYVKAVRNFEARDDAKAWRSLGEMMAAADPRFDVLDLRGTVPGIALDAAGSDVPTAEIVEPPRSGP